MSTSLQLKKDFVKPIIDLAFFILACISASSFSSGVIKEPRYLKDLVKLMRTLLGKSRSSGVVAFEDTSFACFRVGGEYMASDFERRVFDHMLSPWWTPDVYPIHFLDLFTCISTLQSV